MQLKIPMTVGVGSTNPSKLIACARALNTFFPSSPIGIRVHERKGSAVGNQLRTITIPDTLPTHEHPDITIIGVDVDSGVSAQPLTAEETLRGARSRAQTLWNMIRNTQEMLQNGSQETDLFGGVNKFDYCIGLEGGIEKVDDIYLESGYIAVQSRDGEVGVGTSARFQIADHIHEELCTGVELSEVVDRLSSQTDVRSTQGMMGMITNGTLPRDICYQHGVIFALARFVSPKQYWERS